MGRRGKFLAVAGAVCIVAALAIFFPVSRWAVAVVEWARRAGTLGVAVYSVLYIVATVLLVPATILILGAGFTYGPIGGVLLVAIAGLLGATAAFIIGRSLARNWVERKVSGDRRFKAVDRAIASHGFKVVLLLRLSPIFPYILLNYILGLTRVRLRDYMTASFIGMLPATVVIAYAGSLIPETGVIAAGTPRGLTPWEDVLTWVGLAATVAVVFIVVTMARRELARTLEGKEDPPPSPTPS